MKNSLTKIGILAFVIMFTLISCDKDEAKPIELVQEAEMFAMSIDLKTATGLKEKGIIVGTEAELMKAIEQNESGLRIIKESHKNNIFSIAPNEEIGDPFDPDACWNEIYTFYDMYYDVWLQEANENCQDKMVCITCPEEGSELYAMFVIEHNCINEEEMVYDFHRFPFTPNDYESDKITTYIDKM